jgi:hypothetical protein
MSDDTDGGDADLFIDPLGFTVERDGIGLLQGYGIVRGH